MTADNHNPTLAFRDSINLGTTGKSFLVVGLVRDCAKYLKADVLRLKSALEQSEQLHWLIIESDSTDSTLSQLEKLKDQVSNFSFTSLGILRNELPLRTERLAYCRNSYIDQIRTNKVYKNIDYVIVSDFDGLNTHVSEAAIASCWERKDWDMCAANQKGPYYDIWALRHKDWCPNDCFAQYRFLKRFNTAKRAFCSSVYSKMITLPLSSDWIEVDSAFGGLAIYRRKLFNVARYVGLNEAGEEVSEHVSFHRALRQQGYRLFINPKMINASYTDHTEHLHFLKRLRRKSKNLIGSVIKAVIGEKWFGQLKKTMRGSEH